MKHGPIRVDENLVGTSCLKISGFVDTGCENADMASSSIPSLFLRRPIC
jgi:hypothetical protein